ncbi:nucleoside-diphosphate sugar epimerase/dehydratase [Celeribacter arenosi]|uniref:Nucleoside-diphosphate sugar epimerase/dehydratase n=1 Tax=Celeribacter arenosi TaxID=792649 RepID=A0ABP7K0V8_9RHOB
MYNKVLIDGLTALPHKLVRAILVVSDFSMVVLSALLAIGMIIGFENFGGSAHLWQFLCLIGAISLITIFVFRIQLIKLSVFSSRDVLKIGQAAGVLTIVHLFGALMLDVPRAIALTLVFGSLAFTSMVASRAIATVALGALRDRIRARRPVAIFGAGGTGIQLASALRTSPDVRPVMFFDDNPLLHGMDIGGIPVAPPRELVIEAARRGLEQLIIALPESAQERRDGLVEICERINMEVQVLPPFAELLAGKSNTPELKTVDPHDILGRAKVDLDTPEIAKSYAGRVVMVTGAGGSIGSELCRQILTCRPAKIVLFDVAEYNLYKIEHELNPLADERKVALSAHLGSVSDATRVKKVIGDENVEIILHAAAYKHVPLIETNEIEGARNNVMGTKIIADAAVAAGVERFILVSTDKAVRPTNIMGATKRMAELIIQDLQTRTQATKFAMVRFGNVLGSSGSVMPLFQKQLEAGGPLTVTHPDVCRYFMTVNEAARLVLLSGAYATGGDVFVLDMGKPQRIIDIAYKLIKLSGRTVKNPATGEGDIEVKVIGLRPGEKLYEELLIDQKNVVPTPHPKILRAEEDYLSQIEVAAFLREVQQAIDSSNATQLRKVVAARIDGYKTQQLPVNA